VILGEDVDKDLITGPKRDALTDRKISGYSVGHFNNDLCASMWFIYLNYYLQYVVGLTPVVAGAALLSG
jgi:Na+/melibiose symporter-like transporter